MSTFINWLKSENLDFIFNKPSVEVSRRTIKEPYRIVCWRGTSQEALDAGTVSQDQNGRTVSSRNAMEGMFWFTHNLQRGRLNDPEEYARNAAKGLLITYPLNCFKIYDLVKHQDGQESTDYPKGYPMPDSTSKSRVGNFGFLVELPENWFFTWQVEKFIGFEGNLRIENYMVENV